MDLIKELNKEIKVYKIIKRGLDYLRNYFVSLLLLYIVFLNVVNSD